MRTADLARALLAAGVGLLPAFASAQAAPEAKLRDQLRQTILQMRQLEDENASLKAQLATATAAQADAKKLQGSLGAARKRAARADELEQEQQVLRNDYQQLQKAYLEMSEAYKSGQDKSNTLGGQVKETQQQLGVCTTHNEHLADLSGELLARYRDRGFFDVLLAKEPVTGLRRVELEKLEQDYRGKIRDERLAVPATAAQDNKPQTKPKSP